MEFIFKIECACKCDVPVYDIARTTTAQQHLDMLFSISIACCRNAASSMLGIGIIAIECTFSVVIHGNMSATATA